MGRDGWIGIGLLFLSGWLYANLGKIPANPLVPIGPSFYPRFLLVLIVLLSLALLIQDVASLRKKTAKPKTELRTALKKYQPTILSFLIFALYILLLPTLGYLVSTMLFVTALQWLLGRPVLRRLFTSCFIGFLTSLTTYVIFEKYLHVLLPRQSWLP